MNNNNIFDINKRFLSHKIIIFLLIISAILILMPIVGELFQDDYRFCYRPECFNNLLGYFDWSFKVFAGSVVLLTILLTIYHSNLQLQQVKLTNEALEVSRNQNIFSNHYKHLEDFVLHLEKPSNHTEIEIMVPRNLYRKIFPESFSGSFMRNEEFLMKILSITGNISISVNIIIDGCNEKTYFEEFKIISDQTIILRDMFGLRLQGSEHLVEIKNGVITKIIPNQEPFFLEYLTQILGLIIFTLTYDEFPRDDPTADLTNEILKNFVWIHTLETRPVLYRRDVNLDFTKQ